MLNRGKLRREIFARRVEIMVIIGPTRGNLEFLANELRCS